jgi:hypothetical protein
MIWALLALLGVPIWLVLGALGGALILRRRTRSQPGVVRIKIRPVDADAWPRRASWGRGVHDVLVLHTGLALVRCEIRGVRKAFERTDVGAVAPFTLPRVSQVSFDDGTTVLLAVDGADARALPELFRPGTGQAG